MKVKTSPPSNFLKKPSAEGLFLVLTITHAAASVVAAAAAAVVAAAAAVKSRNKSHPIVRNCTIQIKAIRREGE